jgi:hypothetical protein
MDKQLLRALDNLSDSLEQIAKALASKKEGTSATGAALKGGDFGKQLEAINTGIKSIKTDTQDILKNQETILAMSKNNENVEASVEVVDEDVEDISVDKKKETELQKQIKTGVGTILLIALGVLAIGLAFKIVGDINILSVITLALGITLVAIAFERVAKLGVSLKEAAVASITMVMMATAITVSSWVLGLVTPVSMGKMFTAILIGVGFALLGDSIAKMIQAFKGMKFLELAKIVIFLPLILPGIALGIALASHAFGLVKPVSFSQWVASILVATIFTVVAYGIRNLLQAFDGMKTGELIKAAIFLPLLLPAIALGIAGASHVLGMVKPISLGQFFASILIGIIFVVLSYGIRNILQAFEDLKASEMLTASLMIPLLLPAMAAAIWGASYFLSKVQMITFGQFLTALGISVLFVVLSYGIRMIADGISKMSWEDVVKIPVFFTLISIAIMVSSHILSLAVPIDFQTLLKIGLLAGILTIIAIAMVYVVKILSKINIKDLLIGSLAIIVLAAVIMVASWILSVGNYENYPGLDWIIGVGLSLLTFGLAAFALGWLVFGPQALVFLSGLVAILAVAGTILAVSHILAQGKYDNKGMLEWAQATALLYMGFTPIIMVLGLMVFGPQALVFLAGLVAILAVAATILDVSHILAAGKYDNKGMLEWAKATSLLYMVFTPIIMALGLMGLAGAVIQFFGGDDPFEVAKRMMVQIAETIVLVSLTLAKGNYKDGPTEDWAKGVGLAIGAFAPVFKVLSEESGWFVDGLSVEDMSRAILTISSGIITAAGFFAENKAVFDEGNYPSQKWGKGIGAALGAFAPVFEMLSGKSWFSSSDEVIQGMKRGVLVMSGAIMGAGHLFSKGNPDWWKSENAPSQKWGKGVGAAIGAFSEVFTMMSEGSGWFSDGSDVIDDMSYAVIKITRAIAKSAHIIFNNRKYFDADINPSFVKNLAKNVIDYTELAQYLVDAEADLGGGGIMSSFEMDPVQKVAIGMNVLASAYNNLSNSFDKFGIALEKINMEKLREVKSLQTEQLANDLNKIKSEETPSVSSPWSNLKSSFGFGDSPTVGENKKSKGKEILDKSKYGKNGKTMPEQLDMLIDLLTSIDGSTNTIDDYISSIDDSIVNAPPKL